MVGSSLVLFTFTIHPSAPTWVLLCARAGVTSVRNYIPSPRELLGQLARGTAGSGAGVWRTGVLGGKGAQCASVGAGRPMIQSIN